MSQMIQRQAAPTKIACVISVPKCASQSILEILELGENRDDDAREKTERFVIYENHQRLSVLEKKYDLTGKYVFAFVRNPYDRLSSWYQYHSGMEPYLSYDFGQWIRQGCPTHWTIQNQTDWRQEGLTPLLQYNFLASAGTKVDFIGRMENFDADLGKVIHDLNAICASRGIGRRFEFRDVRINRSRSHLNNYTAETRDIAYRIFRKDFEEFGYEA